MFEKRIILFAGHYGSGKTNIAVNCAALMRGMGKEVTIADLDIVNPYFRTKDSAAMLKEIGVPLISSGFANSNVDIPSLPQELYAIVDDPSRSFIIDVGGDDRGAMALGRITPAILRENDYEMLAVINLYRPLTRTTEDVLAVINEVQAAAGLPFTGMVNNSNLAEETTANDILQTVEHMDEISRASGLPVVFTSVRRELASELMERLKTPALPLILQEKYYK